MSLEYLKNFAVNIRATGPAAVLIALIAGITLLGLFGEGTNSTLALSVLTVISGAIAISLAQKC